jgi:hypothetical protein
MILNPDIDGGVSKQFFGICTITDFKDAAAQKLLPFKGPANFCGREFSGRERPHSNQARSF